MKTQTTKRTTRRLAASIAIITALATNGAWAANVYWTGEFDNYWNVSGNWTGQNESRPLPTNDAMKFNSSNYNERFTENVVIADGAYTNAYHSYIDNVGTAENPLVFRATDAAYGLAFGGLHLGDSSAAYLKLEAGIWSTGDGKDIYVGNASKLTVTGGSSLYVGKYFCLRNGEVTLENGTIEVPNYNFELGQNAAVTLNLNEGGVLGVKQITMKTYGGTVVFNGGTVKELSGTTLIQDDSVITVKVGALGGTIDANTFAVSFPRPIAADGENDGGMTFKGGGSVTLKYANSYTGATKIAVRTKLVVTSAELTRLLANGGITVIKPEGVSSKGTFKLLGKSDGDCTAAEYALITKSAGLEGASFDIDEDGDITVTVSHTPQTWAGAAETSATWSGANWDAGVVFDDGNDAVFATDGAIAEVDDDYCAYTLTFNENAALTGSGTLTSPTITVADGKATSIAGPLGGAVEKLGAGTLTLGSSRAGTTTTLTEGTLVANATVGTLTLGTDPTKPVTFDYGGQTYATSFTYDNGCDVTLTNCTFSSFSRVANGTVRVAKGATGYIIGWLSTGPTSDSTDTAAVLDICGGVVSNATKNISLGDHGEHGSYSEVRVRNSGLFTTGNGIVVGARAAATLTIDDGSVITPYDVVFCQTDLCKVDEGCFLNLNAGGLLSVRGITYGSGLANATFTFNGGTLKANQDYTLIANKANMSVVTATSGTIDADGHAVTVAKTISGTGGMTYQGSGKVTLNVQPTYTGVTTVEVGTTLVVPAAIAGDKLAFTVPGGLAGGVYTVVSISGNEQFADNVLDGKAEGFVLSTDKKKICYVKGMDTTKPIYIGTDGNLSDAGNWLNGTVPTGGIGDAQIFCTSAATLTVGDTFAPAKLVIPGGSALVTIGSGTLYVDEVVNRQLLAVGAGATVVIGEQLTLAKGESLCDHNNGTMVVSNLLLKAERGDRFVTTSQTASVPGVFKFNAVTNSMTDNWFYFANKNNLASADVFYIGAGGLNFLNASGTAGYSFGRATSGNSTTIRPWYSDFTIADSGTGNNSLILMRNVTFCTDDESGTGRTIKIDAKTRAQYSPAITVSGTGTLQVNGTCDNSTQPPVTVTDSARLAFGANANRGTGTITHSWGKTRALTATRQDFTALANTLNLPETGTATIRIDGARLSYGDHVIATVASGTTDNVTLDPASAALAGRRGNLRVDDGNLILTVNPMPLMITIR